MMPSLSILISQAAYSLPVLSCRSVLIFSALMTVLTLTFQSPRSAESPGAQERQSEVNLGCLRITMI